MNGPLMVFPVAAQTGRFPDSDALVKTPLPFLGATRQDEVPEPFPPAGSAGAGAGATGAGAGAEADGSFFCGAGTNEGAAAGAGAGWVGTGFPVMDVGKFVGLGWLGGAWLGGAKETGFGSEWGR